MGYEDGSSTTFGFMFGNSSSIPPRMEACSACDGMKIRGSGFSSACIQAFDEHRPLITKPDDLWNVIASAFSRHVSSHAEELRSKFVTHEGKKELHVHADHLVAGETPPEVWETT